MYINEPSGLSNDQKLRNSNRDLVHPNSKTLQRLPDLHKQAELEKIADSINECHALAVDYGKLTIEAGTKAVETAIECGKLLLTVKVGIKHGEFEKWCEANLKFSIRKVQYYMLLARKYSGKDLQGLKPHSIRQALIYAGALPEEAGKKYRTHKFDDLSRLRKKVRAVVLELKARGDDRTDELLKELGPIDEWRRAAMSKMERHEDQEVVDVEAEVQPDK